MNHVLNQALHFFAILFCEDIRKYIIRGGMGLIFKDTTFFIIAYYSWIWQCFFSLGKWPYDFLDLRTALGNKIFGGVAAGCFVVVWLSFSACKFVEARIEEGGGKGRTMKKVKKAAPEHSVESERSSSRSHRMSPYPRPRGRARKDHVWDENNGEWIKS